MFTILKVKNTATYEFNVCPTNVYAKVALNFYVEYTRGSTDTPPYDGQHAGITIKTIRRQRSDGVIVQEDINSNGVYKEKMTNVTIQLYGRDTYIHGILVIEYWS